MVTASTSESEDRAEKVGLESWLVLAMLVVLPGAFATGFTQYEFLKESISFVLGGLILIVWGVATLRGKLIRVEGARIATLLTCLAMFALFAVVWSPSRPLGFIGAAQWLVSTAVFLAVVAPTGRRLRLADAIPALAVGTAVAGAIGVLDLAGVGLTTVVWDPPGAAGAMDAREFAGAYYAIAIPLLVAGVFGVVRGKARALAAVGLLLGAAHFVVTTSTLLAGIVAGVAVVAALLTAVVRGDSVMKPAFMLLLILGAGIGFSLSSLAPSEPNEATSLPWVGDNHPRLLVRQAIPADPRFAIPRIEELPDGARGYLFAVALDLLRAEPVIGHGPNSWWLLQAKSPRYDEPFVQSLKTYYPLFRAPHNGFALTMAELGGIGLALLCMWLSAIAGIALTAFGSQSEDEWALEMFGLTTAVTAGVAAIALTPALQLAASSTLFFIAAGLLVRRATELNGLRGMSTRWHVNREGKRWDSNFFCGLMPIALGVFLIGAGAVWGTFTFYRSWGDLAMLRTQNELAIDKYMLVNDLMPDDPDTLFNAALAYHRIGGVSEARDMINRASELRPYEVRVMHLVATAYLANHNYAEAARAARAAISLFPEDWKSREQFAAALNLQGRMADSAKELQGILDTDPPESELGHLHQKLGELYLDSLDNPQKAAEHLKIAVKYAKGFARQNIQAQLEQAERQVEVRRLQREGKPIPKELLDPIKGHHDHGHDHFGHSH